MKNVKRNNTLMFSGALLALILLFTSCGQEERKKLEAQAQDLETKLHERDSAYNNIMNVMADVESQIEEIKKQENIITNMNNEDISGQKGDKLVSDIQRINDLIKNTNDKVQSLSSQLDNSNLELRAFKKRVNDMVKNLKDRETSIAKLTDELKEKDTRIAELNTEVTSLVTRVQLQTETIEIQNQELDDREDLINKAFFAVNTEKKLLEEGLVTKEGGFLWIGKTTELQANAAQNKFTEVDIQNTKRFYVDSEKMEIVTDHPSGSFKLVNEGEKVKYLEVVNPQDFWRLSKYLVISVKS